MAILIEAGEREMRPEVMASVGVLGFISFSPTSQDREVSGIRVSARLEGPMPAFAGILIGYAIAGRRVWVLPAPGSPAGSLVPSPRE
jgi:hypothetical protein